MLNSTVLEVAIGLVFCFASVALIASSVYEAIASWLNLRSKTLLCGLTELLNARTSEGHKLLLSIYNDALAHPAGNGEATNIKEIKNKPAYIPSKNFALALIHSLQEIPGKLDNVEASINALKDEQLRSLLQNLYRKAGGNLNLFQHELATWFDTGMGRVSGAYKKQSQIWCFVIALAVAVGFNIDCVHLFKTLWLHPASIAQLSVSDERISCYTGLFATANFACWLEWDIRMVHVVNTIFHCRLVGHGFCIFVWSAFLV